ncbi:hypothetical protein DFP72DRAFT_994661 [Ephemerocybe angulata]|uniref:Uncharacterized protein n=1 Tax=Ephemerocybe angulata TaxID=980116 RepID=A0A8H6HA03_9AGAR|nr:hypothetical protein DFP72DRAFT_994661 [Tulosesus angulatus]
MTSLHLKMLMLHASMNLDHLSFTAPRWLAILVGWFIVNIYHYNNHKHSDELCQTWCNPTPIDGSNPNLVIQELDHAGVLQWKRAFNTQASEQLNSWIAGYEQILKRMTVSNFYWFLHSVLYLHMKRVLQKQADRQIGLVIADLGVDVDDTL